MLSWRMPTHPLLYFSQVLLSTEWAELAIHRGTTYNAAFCVCVCVSEPLTHSILRLHGWGGDP